WFDCGLAGPQRRRNSRRGLIRRNTLSLIGSRIPFKREDYVGESAAVRADGSVRAVALAGAAPSAMEQFQRGVRARVLRGRLLPARARLVASHRNTTGVRRGDERFLLQ